METTETKVKIVSPRIRTLMGGTALVMLLFAVVVMLSIMDGRKDALENSRLETESLTNSLTDHVELTFNSADLNLRRAIERQYFNALFGENLKEYMSQQFGQWLAETPQISALLLISETGDIEVSAVKPELKKWADETQSVKADALFSIMRQASEKDLFVGQHSVGSEQHIILARRYEKINGEFGGIVAAMIPSGYFSRFYSTIAFGDKQFMAIELMTEGDKQLFLDMGPRQNQHNYSHLFKTLRKISESNIKQSMVALREVREDGEPAVIGSRKLDRFNVIVHVMLAEQDIFEEWNQARYKDLGFLILFIIFASVISFFVVIMAKQTQYAEESENAAILASQAKSEFLANMSHELRTPLNAIIGYSEMMNSEYFGPINQKQRDRIHDINLCGTHLLQLINDILEFSKGEAGKLELSEEKVNIEEVASEAIRISNAKARSKAIHLTHSLEKNLPYIWADRRKLMQVLLNLLTNAIKFTPESGSVQLSAYTDEHKSLHIIVSDTGVGMREEDIPRALSVFGQVHRVHDQEGTGLGLPLCKMYIELHGGKFLLSSRLNAGTKVHIILPHQRSLEPVEIDLEEDAKEGKQL